MLALLNAERAWAFSMQLKQTAAKLNAKHKHHVKKRLRRAALWAQRLQQLATNSHVIHTHAYSPSTHSQWKHDLVQTQGSWSHLCHCVLCRVCE